MRKNKQTTLSVAIDEKTKTELIKCAKKISEKTDIKITPSDLVRKAINKILKDIEEN